MACKRHIRSGGRGVQRYFVSSGVRLVEVRQKRVSVLIIHGQVLEDYNITSVPRTQVPHAAWQLTCSVVISRRRGYILGIPGIEVPRP